MAECSPCDRLFYTASQYKQDFFIRLGLLYQQDDLCDVTLVFNGKSIKAHRIILAASCPYFRAMFIGKLCERQSEQVSMTLMPDVTPGVFTAVLNFIYTGSVEITVENCQVLLSTANMLGLMDLVKGCSEFLQQNLTVENCIGIYLFADLQACSELKSAAETFSLKHFHQVCCESEFFLLPKNDLIHFLMSESLYVDSEYHAFTAALNWILSDLPGRRRYIFDVLSPIRIPIIPQKYLDRYAEDCEDLSLKIALQKYLQDFKLDRKICAELHLTRVKPYLYLPRKCSRKELIIVGGYSRDSGGRWSDTRVLKSAECFDPHNQIWKRLSSLDYARSGLGVAVLHGLVYSAGGENESLISSGVECFDPGINCWKRVTSMLSPRWGLGLCALNGFLYAIGGWIGSEIGSAIERYNPQLDIWQDVGSTVVKRFAVGMLQYEGLIYVIGGITEVGNETRIMETYNPVTQEWQRLSDLFTRRAYCGVAELDGFIYAVGGWNEFDGTLNSVERYSPDEGHWSKIVSMSVPRAGACVAAVNGILYVIGGRSSGLSVGTSTTAPGTLSSVECYDPQNESWFDIGSMGISRCEAGIAVL